MPNSQVPTEAVARLASALRAHLADVNAHLLAARIAYVHGTNRTCELADLAALGPRGWAEFAHPAGIDLADETCQWLLGDPEVDEARILDGGSDPDTSDHAPAEGLPWFLWGSSIVDRVSVRASPTAAREFFVSNMREYGIAAIATSLLDAETRSDAMRERIVEEALGEMGAAGGGTSDEGALDHGPSADRTAGEGTAGDRADGRGLVGHESAAVDRLLADVDEDHSPNGGPVGEDEGIVGAEGIVRADRSAVSGAGEMAAVEDGGAVAGDAETAEGDDPGGPSTRRRWALRAVAAAIAVAGAAGLWALFDSGGSESAAELPALGVTDAEGLPAGDGDMTSAAGASPAAAPTSSSITTPSAQTGSEGPGAVNPDPDSVPPTSSPAPRPADAAPTPAREIEVAADVIVSSPEGALVTIAGQELELQLVDVSAGVTFVGSPSAGRSLGDYSQLAEQLAASGCANLVLFDPAGFGDPSALYAGAVALLDDLGLATRFGTFGAGDTAGAAHGVAAAHGGVFAYLYSPTTPPGGGSPLETVVFVAAGDEAHRPTAELWAEAGHHLEVLDAFAEHGSAMFTEEDADLVTQKFGSYCAPAGA